MAQDGTPHLFSITSVAIEKCTPLFITMKTPFKKIMAIGKRDICFNSHEKLSNLWALYIEK